MRNILSTQCYYIWGCGLPDVLLLAALQRQLYFKIL